MEVIQSFFLAAFICLDFIPGIVAVLCSFETSHGILQHKHCKERCCEGPDVRFSSVCCYYKRDSEVYIGTGMATLVVLAIFGLCFTYICCRRKLLRQSRESASRNTNTRLTARRRNNVLPTVSEHVQPPVPPPYEILPPPYYTIEQGNSFKKDNTPSLPDEPPPAYSPFDTCTT